MAKVEYDGKYDILYAHKGGEKARFSIEVLGDFVVDIGAGRKAAL